ncbi:MAG: NAD-dependent epimerase/dehydratase family protein [Deltaproteobacteria bacterium]|nr:MAG: NAD-dependent epimerase/dehydratase family protein [Deltaproteobacteria bacterium]
MCVAIAGATGFVGRALLNRLAGRARVVGLSRNAERAVAGTPADLGVQWREANLFSLLDTERALRGVDIAVYLVHSMLPPARLTQGSFRDLDLLLADNFARAAASCGVRRIVYLGGIIPREGPLSEHLESRLEVERALGRTGVPVTALRAGLVIGERGSSFRILERLVRRLPVMVCPSWMRVPTQPVALEDLLRVLDGVIFDDETAGVTSDVAGPDVITYLELVRRTALAMGREPRLVPVPFVSPGLSKLWVSAITGVSHDLVAPLVQSLRMEMLASDTRLQERFGAGTIGMDAALRAAMAGGPHARARRAVAQKASTSTAARREALRTTNPQADRSVCSVQRLPLPAGWDAEQVASAYARWLPRALRPLMRVELSAEESVMAFRMLPLSSPLLTLTRAADRSDDTRQLFYITGGLLADTHRSLRGRLEFRAFDELECSLAAIHEFTPRLPWWLYTVTQAKVHLWVMSRFRSALRKRRLELPGGSG